MRWLLFREGASAVEKGLTVGWLLICPVGLFGLLNKFSPAAGVWQGASVLAAMIAAACTVALQLDGHLSSRMRSFGRGKRLWHAAMAFTLMLGMAVTALALGLGAIVTTLFGADVELRARVVHISNPNHGKGCKFAFSVKYSDADDRSHGLCASEDFWASLGTGQHITVVQRRSSLGSFVVGFRSNG